MKKRNLLVITLVMVLMLVMTSFPVFADKPTTAGKFLDNFDRAEWAASNLKLSDDTLIYWNQSGAGTFSIVDGVLNAKMNEGGYYRFATNNTDNFKYVVLRIKGNSSAVNDKIYTRIGVAEKKAIDDDAARGDKSFTQIIGPDGKAIPKVTSEWQTIVIDVAKSGFSLGGGSNAFQIGAWQAMDLDIDYIFMTNDNPLVTTNTAASTATSTVNSTAVSNPKTGDNNAIIVSLAVIAVSAAVLVVLFRKKEKVQQ